MDYSVLATLLSLTMLAAMIGLLVAVLLLWVAPKNAFFEALESVREALVSDKTTAKQSQTPSKRPVKPSSVAPTKSSVPPPAPEEASIPRPIAANTDLPQDPGSMPAQLLNENEASPEHLDAELDNLSFNRFLDGKMEENQDEEILANQEEEEEETLQMDASEAEEASLAKDDLPTPSLVPEFENSQIGNEDGTGEEGPGQAALIAMDGKDEQERQEELEPGFGSRDTLLSQEPEAQPSDHVLGASNNAGAWATESTPAQAQSSRVEVQGSENADTGHQNESLGRLTPETPSFVPSEPPLQASEEWADLATPHISKKAVMVSERSTVAVGSWDAGAAPEENIESETVKGSGQQNFDDREEVRGDGSRQLLSSSVNDLIENDAPRIRSNWELKPAEHKLDGADYAFADGIKEGDVKLDNRHDMSQPDVGFRGEPIKPKHVIIERDDEEPTADQLRLEALKNEDLRGVLMSIKNTDSDQFSTSITDLSEERGEGHRRHTSFYGGGAPRTETDTFGGTAHGSFRAWYESGQAMVEGKYNNGAATGVWTLWDQQGNQLICAEISKVLSQWDYKAKVRYIETSKPAASS